MPDGAIVIPDTSAAPKDYTLAGAQEVALKSVRAVIDGTGAGSAFLPTLQLLDANGHVCWEGATPTTVAAGGSADVSWFPSVGATSGSSSGTVGATAYLWGVSGAQNVVTTPGSTRVKWAHFQTNDTAIFGTDTTAVAFPGPYHNTTGDSFLYFNAFGSYVCAGMAQLATGVYAQSAIVNNDGNQWLLDQAGPDTSSEESIATNTDAFGTAGGWAPRSHRLFYLDAGTANGIVALLCQQNSGANKALANVSLGLIYGDGGTGTLTQIY